jgi:acyl-CoA thioesterase FadM
MTKSADSRGIKSLPEQMRDLDQPFDHNLEPYRCRVRVGWGDCDPARIAYTARIPEWVLDAIEGWYVYCLCSGWYEMNLERGIGTPFVSLNCDFFSPVTPRHPLEMAVYVSRLGRASLSHHVDGYQDDVLCFTASTTASFVDASAMKAVPIPANMRSNIENYKRNQGREFADS